LASELSAQSPAEYNLNAYVLTEESAVQWKLHKRLREISGLAATADGRVWGHDDELGIIYEIDYSEGKVVKVFAFGLKTPVEDFEGIAAAHGKFYLVDSDGRIYEGSEGDNDERVLYNTYETRIGVACEVEGLEYEPEENVLLLLCKRPRVEALRDQVAIFRWSLDQRAITQDTTLVPVDALVIDPDEKDEFRPSGIARNPSTGTYFVISAQQNAIAEVTPQGEVLAVKSLPKKVHRQVEGITFVSENTLLLADEGGNKRATLTLYRPAR
jgi:uncharacterized protein YjiK